MAASHGTLLRPCGTNQKNPKNQAHTEVQYDYFVLASFRLFIIILYYTDQRSTERRFDGIYASTPHPGTMERNHLLSLMIFCDVIITSLEACWCARFAPSRTFAFVQNKQKFNPACARELACTVQAAPGTGRKECVIFTAGFRLNYSGFSTCSYTW